MQRLRSLSIVICILVILDAFTKALVRTYLHPSESIPILGNVLRITFIQNYSGFSWWVPRLSSWMGVLYQAILIFIVITAFPVYLFYTQTRRRNLWTDAAFVGIVSASLGHLLGDISQPYTTDFIQIFHSPCANFADIYSYMGIGALIIEKCHAHRNNTSRGQGIRCYLADMAASRKEFIQFIKKGFKVSSDD